MRHHGHAEEDPSETDEHGRHGGGAHGAGKGVTSDTDGEHDGRRDRDATSPPAVDERTADEPARHRAQQLQDEQGAGDACARPKLRTSPKSGTSTRPLTRGPAQCGSRVGLRRTMSARKPDGAGLSRLVEGSETHVTGIPFRPIPFLVGEGLSSGSRG